MNEQPNPPAWLRWLVGIFCAAVMALAAPGPKPTPADAPPDEQSILISPVAGTDPEGKAANRQDADAGFAWLTWPEAHAEQLRTGRPVLVLVSFEGCRPCARLKKLLDDPATFERFTELGIPCVGHSSVWQGRDKTKWQAPAIVYADGRDKPPMLADLNFTTADVFLKSLQEWINAID